MKVKLVNNSGSGHIADPSPISYSYSEDVTSLEPSSLTGGSGQVNISALAVDEDKVGNTHPNSRLLINNSMSLVHEDSGEVEFKVKQATVTAGVVSIIGSTLEDRLNVERTAAPHGGSGYTLFTAINYYCSLVDIYYVFGTVANYAALPSTPNQYDAYVTLDTDVLYVFIGSAWVQKQYRLNYAAGLDTTLDAIPVNFIGWKGNVWEHLKMLCAAMSISTADDIGLEFFADINGLNFRTAKTSSVNQLARTISSSSVSVDSIDAAQSLDIYNYNTSYKVQSVVHDTSQNRDNVFVNAQNATFYDGLQVNAGEVITKRFTIDASLETVYQPTAVDSILPFPYSGGTGEYCIAGADGIFITAAQWTGEGGKLKVALTENPNEIEVTLIAPVKNGLENITGGGALSFEPYKIGVESAGNNDYPAIYITGDGVFYNKTLHTIATGAASEYTSQASAPTIDNPFVTTTWAAYTRGAAAAQVTCGPNVTLGETYSDVLPFGSTPGSLRTVDSNKYRIASVNYNVDNTTITAKPSALFSDFNAKWAGKTFVDFKTTALDPTLYPDETLKFNEFTVIPLMNP